MKIETVGQLVEALQKLDQNKRVLIYQEAVDAALAIYKVSEKVDEGEKVVVIE